MNTQDRSLAISERIIDRINPVGAGEVSISDRAGGVAFANMGEVMEFAKMMAVSGGAIPPHLRNRVGECLAVCIQALEWRLSPYAVANKSYFVNDRIAYESQLVHAVIEQRAPLKGRLRCRYEGEGDGRRCIVWATPVGEEEPLEFESSPIGKITPKNSPLWKTKPDLQLFYNASRDWCRMYFPDVLLGIYTREEMDEHQGFEQAKDITPAQPRSLAGRLDALAAGPAAPQETIDRETGEILDEVDADGGEQATSSEVDGDLPNDSLAKIAPAKGEKRPAASPTEWTEAECSAYGRKAFADGMARKAVIPPELRGDTDDQAYRATIVIQAFDHAAAEAAGQRSMV